MVNAVLAVFGGFILWSVLWVGGSLVLLPVLDIPEETVITTPAQIGAFLALSVVCSLAGGAATAFIGRRRPKPVLALAIVLLLVGIAVQASSWDSAPAMYHIPFLLLLVPMTLLGGRLAGARAPAK